jgi:hypothetical protein
MGDLGILESRGDKTHGLPSIQGKFVDKPNITHSAMIPQMLAVQVSIGAMAGGPDRVIG